MLKIINGIRPKNSSDQITDQWIRKETKCTSDAIALFAAVLAVAFFLICVLLEHGVGQMSGDGIAAPLAKFNSPYFGR